MTKATASELYCVVSNNMLVDGEIAYGIQPYDQEIDWSMRHEFTGTQDECDEWVKAHSKDN